MGFVVKAVKGAFKAIVGVASKVIGGVFGFAISGGSKKKAKSANNLNKSLDPETSRKICFGRIAVPLDLRYWEVYGPSGSLYAEVLANATHRIHAYKELYLEQNLAISATGVVQAAYIGVLTRSVRLGTVGQAALAVGSGSQWNATSKFTGCAHMALHWNPDEKKLPNGIPSRYTQVCECAPVYDPRRDSTVAGGSGTHRINDQNTWDYAALDANGQPIGRNNALQALWYVIGWRIANPATGEAVLVAGRGVDPQDINLALFIAGANACEAAGYYTDMILSTDEDHTTNEEKITCDGLIGRLLDPGGLWSYYANVDDTANIAVDLTDADVLQGNQVRWDASRGMADQFNQVSGKYVNGSAVTLYQAFPYPMVRDATYEANLGIKRRKTQDFEQVLDYQLAQRLARLFLNQGQYQGEHSASWNYKALRAQAWSVVRYTSERFGWTKLFRVYRHDISTDSGVGLLLREIHPSIWTVGTVAAALAPAVGSSYNPSQQIALAGLAASQQVVTGPGVNPTIVDASRVSWTAPPENVRRTEVRYRVQGTTYWETVPAIMRGAIDVLIFPLVRGATYEVQARHISIHEVEGAWSAIVFVTGTAGNVTYAGVIAAGTTADVSSLTDTVGGAAPARSNILTSLGVSLGFQNQAAISTDATAKPKLDTIAPGATSGKNILINGDAEGGLTLPWANNTANAIGAGNSFSAASTNPISGKHSFLFAKGALANAISYFTPAIKTEPGKIYIIRFKYVGSTATANGIFAQIFQKTVAPATTYITQAEITSDIKILNNAAAPVVITEVVYTYTVPATINYFSLALTNFVNGPLELRFDEISIVEVIDLEGAEIGNKTRISKLRPSDGRVRDPLMYDTQSILGIGSTANGLLPTYTVNGSNWTVSIPAHTRKLAGETSAYSLSYSAGSGVVLPSKAWWAYVLDTNLTGGTLTITFTYNPDDLLQAGIYVLASGVSPASGTSNPPPPSTGEEPVYDPGGGSWRYRGDEQFQ